MSAPTEKLVSVIMGLYNGESYLSVQIESILKQSHRNLELLIFDDLSEDSSLSIARKYESEDPRVRVVQNSLNLGISLNFLNGLLSARGSYICFADQDDYWEHDKLELLSRILDERKDNMLAYSDLAVCDEDLKLIDASFWMIAGIKPRKGRRLGEMAILRNIIPGCSMMFRREVLDILIHIKDRTSFLHDHLAFIIASNIGRVDYCGKALVKYRQHAANQIGVSHRFIYDRNAIREKVAREIPVLKKFLNADLKRLEMFTNELSQKNIMRRLHCLKFYLFIRRDRGVDQILGFLECLSPSFYDLFRHLKDNQ